MPLTSDIVPITLGKGINTKVDSKAKIPGELDYLINAKFDKESRLSKRNGYDSLGTLDVEGNSVGDILAVTTYKKELLAYTGESLYSYSEAKSAWAYVGPIASAIIKSEKTAQAEGDQYVPNLAISASLEATAYVETPPPLTPPLTTLQDDRLKIVIKDVDTGVIILKALLDERTAIADTKVLAIGTKFYVFAKCNDSGTYRLYGHIIDTVAGTITSTSMYAMNVGDIYDAATNGTTITVARTLTNQIIVADLNGSLGTITTKIVNSLAGTPAIRSVVISYMPNGNILMVYSDYMVAAPTFKAWVVIMTVSTLAVTHQSSDGVGAYEMSAVAATTDDSVNISIFGEDTFTGFASYVAHNVSTLVTTSNLLQLNAALWTDAFMFNGRSYITLIHGVNILTELQNGYYIVRDDGVVVGRSQYASADAFPGQLFRTIRNLKTVNIDAGNSGKFIWASVNKDLTQYANGDFSSSKGVIKTSFDFFENNAFVSAEISDTLFIAGGILSQYDGFNVVEQGFMHFPEEATSSPPAIYAPGVFTGGVHSYCYLYKWVDNNGKINYSAPSFEYQFTATASQAYLFKPYSLTMTNKIPGTVIIELYMTEVSGTIFYKASEAVSITAGVTSLYANISDADLILNRALYTTGGTLPNYSPPACSFIETFKQRLVVSGLENPLEYWYSKINAEGVPIEFANEFSDVVEGKGGDITAIATLDDKLMLFKKDRPYYIFGDGPNNLGVGAFSIAQDLSVDVGCSNSRSVVRFSSGILFKTDKGIYGIDAGFNVVYIGAKVEDFNPLEITSAVLINDRNEIRFTTRTGGILVYNYYFGQWEQSILSPIAAGDITDSTIWQDSHVVSDSNGLVFVEKDNAGTYTDDGEDVLLSLKTGWLSFAGINGFVRVRRLLISSNYVSEHTLTIRLYYNNNDQDYDEYTYNTTSLDGASSKADRDAYDIRLHLTRQKCSSIKVEVIEATSVSGESLQINALAFEVGRRRGVKRLSTNKSIGGV